ncbi:MAG: hypothetical protein HY401_00935 [Elusimicrobia bacterium]|nr:hypothetical protein [Elusimicrobiota bacterium]
MSLKFSVAVIGILTLGSTESFSGSCEWKIREMADIFIAHVNKTNPSLGLHLVGIKSSGKETYAALMEGKTGSVALYADVSEGGLLIGYCRVVRHEIWKLDAQLKPIERINGNSETNNNANPEAKYSLRNPALIKLKNQFDQTILPPLNKAVARLDRKLGYKSGLGFESEALPIQKQNTDITSLVKITAEKEFEHKELTDGFEFTPLAFSAQGLDEATSAAIGNDDSISEGAAGRRALKTALQESMHANPQLKIFFVQGWDCAVTATYLLIVDPNANESLWLGRYAM